MQTQNLSVINSIIYNECTLGENVTIHNSIVGNRVTLGDNCCIQSVDFSKEVEKIFFLIFFNFEIYFILRIFI